jgi:hypothetical protein
MITITASAATRYSGLTEGGDVCFVNYNPEENAVGFYSNGVGHVFVTSFEEINSSVVENQTFIYLESGDIVSKAKIQLNLKANGTLDSAVFKQRNLVFPTTITCYGLYPVKN